MTNYTIQPSNFFFGKRLVKEVFLSLCLLFLFAVPSYADETIFVADTFLSTDTVAGEGWTTWFQRDEIRPDFGVAEFPTIGGKGSLMISGESNSVSHGCWLRNVSGIEGGDYYRFEASYTTQAVPYHRRQVLARLDWRNGDGDRSGRPEYVTRITENGDWRTVDGVFRAPDSAVSVEIELYLGFCDQGVVWWDGIRLEKVSAPAKRMVRAATANCYPRGLSTSAESVEEYVKVAEQAGQNDCDIICLGEGVNLAGVRGAIYPDIAEPIPGPTTERLGEVAKKWNMYIVAALGERDGHALYCTAVLIDRDGKLAGKYRKVHIPREEIETGLAAGSSYPVFDTDFGRIGMMICWDNQYAEPARALAFQGAEMIFLPIWGGNTTLTKARAIENQVHIVSSSYSNESAVYDPWGNVLALAEERPGIAWADINLNETHPEPWLGNMRDRFFHELRTDIPVPGLYR